MRQFRLMPFEQPSPRRQTDAAVIYLMRRFPCKSCMPASYIGSDVAFNKGLAGVATSLRSRCRIQHRTDCATFVLLRVCARERVERSGLQVGRRLHGGKPTPIGKPAPCSLAYATFRHSEKQHTDGVAAKCSM